MKSPTADACDCLKDGIPVVRKDRGETGEE